MGLKQLNFKTLIEDKRGSGPPLSMEIALAVMILQAIPRQEREPPPPPSVPSKLQRRVVSTAMSLMGKEASFPLNGPVA